MKVVELIARAMKEARGNAKALGDIAIMADRSAQGHDTVDMRITFEDVVDHRRLCEPFIINASSQADFEAVLKIMARIAMRDAEAAKIALQDLGLDDKVINAIVLDE